MKTAVPALFFALLSGTIAFAGGPVVVIEEKEVVLESKPASSAGLLLFLLISAAICIFLCANDADKDSG